MENKWVEHASVNQEGLEFLRRTLNVDPVLCSLLLQRQICDFEQARLFFRPDLSQLHDPFLMQDMKPAISRIERAINDGEKILVYGDYDVDGTTAVALVFSYLKELYSHIDYYVPDREKEGYGISRAGINWAKENGFSLIIALDCGIKSVDMVKYADEIGIDFIIGDHHTPGNQLPPAIAVLDPKRDDCVYPYKELSGCGIGFKIIQAHAKVTSLGVGDVFRYLDLVAVSIASDIVPMTGENRILAYYGLKKLNANPCPGLKALKGLSTHKPEFEIEDIIFQIGPRINAAGRIRHASDAVQLLIAETDDAAIARCSCIETHNLKRREVDARITEEALEIISSDSKLSNKRTTVLYHDRWHKGVIGIVASRLIDAYYRPTVILTKSNGYVTGSARSVTGFDLYKALDSCNDLLIQFGGHKYAAGLTLEEKNVPAFKKKFETVVANSILPEQLTKKIEIDHVISFDTLNGKFLRVLKQFAPFGPQNTSPVFLTRGVQARPDISIVGKDHLRMRVWQNNSDEFNCIGFGLGKFYNRVQDGTKFDMCYQVTEHIWKDNRFWQLNIKDIKVSQA